MRYIKLESDYKLVYQGGHHNVYCNGEKHIRTEGGFCHPPVNRGKVFSKDEHPFSCDCQEWVKE